MAAKTKVLFVRVNEEDHARITAHAAAAGQGVAEYMRRKATKEDTMAAREALAWLHLVAANAKATDLNGVHRIDINVNLARLVDMIDRLETAL